jgi:hypothetical protein
MAVLAALERTNAACTLPEVSAQFPHLAPSAVLRVLDALERRGRVTSTGNRFWVYIGAPEPGFPSILPPDQVVRFEVVNRRR